MGRIKNQDKYILDQQISANDYLVGSDAEDLGKRTKSFRVGDLAAFMGGSNGTPTWEIRYYKVTLPQQIVSI